jgi:mono/diheme cytochrome c family protein
VVTGIAAVCTLLVVGGIVYLVYTNQHRGTVATTTPDKTEVEKIAAPGAQDDAGARKAFLAAYTVFMHPRCMNCHPSGDVPLQGDDSHLHAQNVKRGADGKGKYALKCANCHQEANVAGENMPPGNPNWHLPPPEMRMVFQGKTAADLAKQLKDPEKNGHKTLEQLIKHVSEDKLVLGCWTPGDGRTKPPLSHEEFAQKVREWVEKGAPLPE